jgi:hypothetical protein
VLRGDIGTGKSALLKRLRGGGFTAAYEPRRVTGSGFCSSASPPRTATLMTRAFCAAFRVLRVRVFLHIQLPNLDG